MIRGGRPAGGKFPFGVSDADIAAAVGCGRPPPYFWGALVVLLIIIIYVVHALVRVSPRRLPRHRGVHVQAAGAKKRREDPPLRFY